MKKILLTLIISAFSLSAYCEFDFWGIFNTQLEVHVVDINGNGVGGAKICLYKNKSDYIKEKNPVIKAEYTDKDGFGFFRKLEPKVYYVVVRKGKMDNSGKNPIISKLSEGDKNKVTIVIQ
jgi:hypothetical protein